MQGAAAAVLLLFLMAGQGARAGLVISTDNSDLCNSNMKDCSQRCPPPQNFVFMCSSGGTFSKPQSDCKCITPPPAGVVTDGSSTWQMVQWPGPDACQGNTWLYDCAQYMNLNAVANNLNGQATDQASAMAAVAAAKAAAEAQAAQEAQMAAMAAQQQQQQQQSGGQAGGAAAGPAPAGVPGMDPGVPGMGGAAGGSPAGGMSPAGDSMGAGGMAGGQGGAGGMGMVGQAGAGPMGGQGAGGFGMAGQQAGAMGGMGGMGAPGGGMGGGGGAGMMGSPATSSLMGANSFGHRHLLQLGGALPSTQLGAACQKPIQGVVTGANSGILVIPNFKGVGAMATRGNDTMMIQLGGQGSQCVAAYKLMGGKIMDVGRTKEEVQKQQDAVKSGAAAAHAPVSLAMLALILGYLVL